MAKKGYNSQTGKPTGRDAKAMKRLEKLAKEYEAKGMPPKDAKAKAREAMRANPRKDWRHG